MSLDFVTADRSCLQRRFNLPLSLERERHESFTLSVDSSGDGLAALVFRSNSGLCRLIGIKPRLVACLPHVGPSAPLAGTRLPQSCGFHSLDIFRHSVFRRPNLPIAGSFGKNGETVDRAKA